MRDDVLIAAAEAGEDGKTRILAPAIGLWRDVPLPGSLLGPGSKIGTLAQGNRTRALLIPDGVSGRIADGLPGDRVVPVEHGQVLFQVTVLEAGSAASESHAGASDAGLAAGTWGIAAPTDGIFYASPAPGSPPFVHVGSRIAAGQPVGLVEVMKTFNQILYGGAGLPPEAEVREVRCADREEIRAGQLLIVVGACST